MGDERRLTAPLLAILLSLLLAASSCQRSLENARCECVAGYTCCPRTNKCLLEDKLSLLCPDDGGAQDASTEAAPDDGSAQDVATEAAPADGSAQEAASETARDRPDDSAALDGAARGNVDADADHADADPADADHADANLEAGLRTSDGSVDGNDDNRDAPVDTPPLEIPGLCTGEGWCWTHPLPTGDRFLQSFGVGDEVWAISVAGAIACFRQDATWYAVPSPMPSVYTLWGASPKSVWAGGDEGLYHWDGEKWAMWETATDPWHRAIYAIWGCGGAEDFWAIGDSVGHWQGGRWTFPALPEIPSGDFVFETMWGSACDDVWAGGTELSSGAGEIIHWNGTAWSRSVNTPADKLVGTARNDVWSLAGGALSRWDGGWASPSPGLVVTDLFAAGPGQIGTLDSAHNVTLFTGLTSLALGVAPTDVTAIYARSATDLWGFGGPGTVRRRTVGGRWDTVLQPWSLDPGSSTRVTGSGATNLWAAVGGTLLRGDGSTWRTALTSAQTGGRIRDIWARASDDVRVLGDDAVIHRRDGNGNWTTETLPPPTGGTSSELRAIAGTSSQDVWVIRGSKNVLHWDGNMWVPRQPFQIDNLVDVWAAGPDDAWVVGDGVSHWSGGQWTKTKLPSQVTNTPFSAVAGGGGDVFFLAGGRVLHADPGGESLSEVFNSDSRVVAIYVAGLNDGWLLQQEAALTRVYRITGSGAGDINLFSIAPAGINDIWAAPDGTVWLAGSGGALLRHPPTKM